MKKLASILILSACFISIQAGNTWHESFLSPQKETSPWTFWYWMYGCVTDEGIRKDLHAMSDAGISGFYLMPIKDTTDGKQYNGTARQLSPEWWKRMDTVFRTADSLNLQMGIHFSDGFALGGGPWIKPEESMQKVVWSDTVISGGRNIRIQIDKPSSYKDYYEDIAVFAYPVTGTDNRKPKSSVEFPYRSSEPCDIIMSYDEPFTLRSVKVVTGGNNYQAHRLKLYASDNGTDYRFIREISPARQGWQNTDAQATYAIPTTKARFFKFHWTPEGSDPGSEDMDAAKWKPNLKIGGLILSSEPKIDGYEGKSGAVWRVSKAFALDDDNCVQPDEIKDITSSLSGDVLNADLPKGEWRILRMGHTSTGHTNATGGGAKGLECDKFSRVAINKQLDNWFANIYRHAPQDIVKKVLTRLHVDSWECGSQNWSSNFAAEFKARRGYDLMPWLPLYAGVPMQTSAKSDLVLRDIRLTIAELINDIFFDEMEKAAGKYDCKLSCECVAPTMVSDGLLHYQHADYPMGEFWLNSPTHDKPNDMLDAVSGAHIYGKNIVQAEGFTEVRGTWDEHPGMLKALLDRNYCLGINSIVFHVNTHNPWTDRAPGMTLDGIGTFFQRDNTWWEEMPAFTGYISRCQALLQYGRPVVDLAVYTGDETPRRAILPERLITSLPGLFGDKLIERERIRMANEGQPLEVSPVGVTHTANMTKAENWINPLHGYHYDSFNHDVLNDMRVENGDIITKSGMRYSALVMPQARPMNPDNITACDSIINILKTRGARIISEPWTEGNLDAIGIRQDATLPEGIDYAHRHADDADIYFISNQTDREMTFSPLFRAERTYRYIADPMTGKVYNAGKDVTLTAGASLFFVFTDQSIGTEDTPFIAKYDNAEELNCNGWNVTFEKNGKSVTSDTLFDWSKSAEQEIRFYSGHATYRTTFRYKNKPQGQVLIDLGQVENIATVYVNGQNCGTTWMAPHYIDITKALKKGKNELEIVVVNTWANALQGNDQGTPPFEGIWTNGKYRRASKELLPAGLLGTIRLINNRNLTGSM